MREKVVRSYQRSEPAPPAQLITVVEDVGGTIEAWHVDTLLKEFSTFTSVAAAIEEARDEAESYSVDASSSLRIRVRETISHSHILGTADERYGSGKTVLSPYKVRERHVLDVISGPIEHDTLAVEWTSGAVVGFDSGARDPGQDLVSFVEPFCIRGFGARFLYDGYGYANFSLQDVSLSPYAEGPEIYPPSARELSRCASAIKMTFRGRLEILTPKGTKADDVLKRLADEQLDIACRYDWERSQGVARHWRIFCGEPVAAMAFSTAPAA